MPSHAELQSKVPKALQWYKVDWQPHPEPLGDIEAALAAQPGRYQHLLLKLQQLKDTQCAPPTTRQHKDRYHGLELTNLAKQGIYSEHAAAQQRYNVALGETINSLVNIHPQPINPHTDIEPSHGWDISIQQVTCILKGAQTTNTIACIHPPDGSTPFTMPVKRMQTLYKWFVHTKNHNPQLHDKLQAEAFLKRHTSCWCDTRRGLNARG